MWNDTNDGRVFGLILLGLSVFVGALAVWERFFTAEAETTLAIPAIMLLFSGVLVLKAPRRKDTNDAGR